MINLFCYTRKVLMRAPGYGLRILLVLICIHNCSGPVLCQLTDTASFDYVAAANKAAVRKYPGRALVNLVTAELTPFVIDRYIRNMDYAKISWQSAAHNINPGNWEWDGDGFTTNQFGHPYHGSLFFNAFRSNGYNFWRSAAGTFAGSYLWETFAENQAPAPNDFINTGFGGMILGELTHRFAGKMINSNRRGFRRQSSELMAFVVNPMNGFNRILNGSWGRYDPDRKKEDTTLVETELDVGMRQFSSNRSEGKLGLFGRFRLNYGNPFGNYREPFSYVTITAEFGHDDSSAVNVVSVNGLLRGWLLQKRKQAEHLVMISAAYDYIRNSAFFYSAQSVRAGMLSWYGNRKKVKVNTMIGGGLILLAAVPDLYVFKGRYYDYCMGLGYNGSLSLSIKNHVLASISYRGGFLVTVSGSASNYVLHTVNTEWRYKINDRFSVCAEPGYLVLNGNYSRRRDVTRTYPYVRFSVRYSSSFR